MKVNFPENPENYGRGSWGPLKAPLVGRGQSRGRGTGAEAPKNM